MTNIKKGTSNITRNLLKTSVFGISILLLFSMVGQIPYAAAPHGLPHATVKVWNITPTIGFNPGESVEDIGGLTVHVATAANPLTIGNVIENTSHPEGPCGLIYYNPVTNSFKWYGITGGSSFGIDLNRNAPTFTGPAGTAFPTTGDPGVPFTPTFQPGDVWVTVNAFGGFSPVYVNFKGTDFFRHYSIPGANGIQIDQATGKVWLTDPAFFAPGSISLLDPATNSLTTWPVGGSAHFIALDSAGMAYSAVGSGGGPGVDQIVRIDAGTNTVTRWAVPGGGLLTGLSFETPDGITLDSAGDVWFAEKVSGEVGQLNVATNTFSEYTKPGLSDPQLVASSGSGATLQTYFTENTGNSVSIVTPDAIANGWTPAPLVTVVPPTSSVVTPSVTTAPFTDTIRTPLTATITPTVFDVPGVDGTLPSPLPAGYPKTTGPDGIAGTADDEPISGVLRFAPMPTPAGGSALSPNNPSGVTGVVAGNTIYGSYLDADFASNSAVFELKSGAIIAPPPREEPPGPPSEPRTMGFWKNHEVATTSLLPQTLGTHVVDTFAKAKAVFDAADAKNAHNMLAAQLLAAKLNKANGAITTCVDSAISDADGILSTAGYTGPNSTTPPAKTVKDAVNAVKDKLDKFNQNGC